MKIVGYTAGVFDMFHVGHLNILRESRKHCDHLIVGVSSDALCVVDKGRPAIIPQNERMAIVESVRYVDRVVVQEQIDYFSDWEKYRFDVVTKGDDWAGSTLWNGLEERFQTVGVRVMFFPYTRQTSSTYLRSVLARLETTTKLSDQPAP